MPRYKILHLPTAVYLKQYHIKKFSGVSSFYELNDYFDDGPLDSDIEDPAIFTDLVEAVSALISFVDMSRAGYTSLSNDESDCTNISPNEFEIVNIDDQIQDSYTPRREMY